MTYGIINAEMEDKQNSRRRSFAIKDINRHFRRIRRQVGSYDSAVVTLTEDNESIKVLSPTEVYAPKPSSSSILEEDFFDIISKFQNSRLDDQRSEMPVVLLKQQSVNLESLTPLYNGSRRSLRTNDVKEKRKKEPVEEVLALGAPYPMVVLPVEGDYWMEGTYHVLSRDLYDRPIFPTIDRSRCILDEDQSVYTYRKHFAGKEHINYVGVDSKHGPILMSVSLDQNLSNKKISSSPTSSRYSSGQYKVLLRLKEKTINRRIPTTAFLSDYPGPRDFMKYLIDDDVDVDRFHPVVAPRASEDIMRFDEHSVSNCYKIGVLHQKHGQISEEEYLQNPEETPALKEFLDSIGNRVELKDFPHYRGGLDVKHGQTGQHSYYTNFKEREIMFHVSSMIPYKPNDSQQLSRKRHIGNDVVSIVFQEENTPFSPNSIRSHFLHCFVVVQVENPNTDDTHYKVSIAAKEGVPKFAPSLPNPCIFKKGEDFRHFLLTKLLNAENAAVKSDKFSALAGRTRGLLLQGIVTDFISKNEKMLEDDNLSCVSETTDSHCSKSNSFLSTFRSALHRSSRSEHDTVSISSTSTNITTNLNTTKSSGQSLSLNDLNDLEEDEMANDKKESASATLNTVIKRAKKEKDKNKKERTKNTQSVMLQNESSASHSIQTPSQHRTHTQQEVTRSRCRSRFYSNQLFEEIGEDLATQNIPKNQQATENKVDNVKRISITSINSDEENNNANSNQSKKQLDEAKDEIEKLKAEISKLRNDKMDLIRQNVKHQQEIKRMSETSSDLPSSQSTNDLRSLSLKQFYSPRKMYKTGPTTFAEFV